MNVDILLFDGFDELDAVGPYEVLRLAGRHGGDIAARLVTVEGVAAVEARNGLRVRTDGHPDDNADLLLVPGGGWNDSDAPGVRREHERGVVPEFIADRHADGVTVASVCTGAMLLAKAGLLDGRPATTHHTAHEDLSDAGANLRTDRFVDDGDVLTAGGITAGFDLALAIVEDHCGADIAAAVATELEYERAI
ncbi:PfpI family protease [Natronomonas pharaonis DSM 2160]|uniref:PfpI family protease n=1 Tax=Natronomonas pharaonis (strain ATCC 35678 / DSM 2160 / CIP 103997 / JCM 8858 / NBRC 14720 / NCIMB 2260 / Gabara) TaxID=348780 RepID=Q3IML1_NATPD|nr:DJ-1/PfpI family protein [Natronomonas pharaonis]CAI50647.1 PfpI family protease [Natronomonas pharaonis DSM 2160]